MKQDYLRTFVNHVERTAAEFDLWSEGDSIVVAVSGGPDSVALLHVLHEISMHRTPLRLICAHVHHGFREESDQEAEMVRELAERLGLPLETAFIDIPAYMEESGKGGQEAAREKRYEFLLQTAHKYNARSVALAHHADDQAETVLMRLLRGSGLSGLAGIKFKRTEKKVELIRPFLRMYKADIVELCRICGFQYAVDNSNLQTKYRRNAIRLEVLPFLERYNGQFSSSLNQLAEIVQQEDDFVELEAAKQFRSMVQENDGRLAFDAPSFLGLHVALQRRLIKLILNYLPSDQENTDFVKIETVRHGILNDQRSNWRLDLGDGITCVREYGVIQFWPKPPEEQGQYIYILDSPDVSQQYVKEIGKMLKLSLKTGSESRSGSRPSAFVADFDADELRFPLTLRNRQPGDKMKIMGLNGSKKVKDILIDEKIPPSVRARIPILCDGSGSIVWIPGVRRSVHAACGRHTSRVLRMELSDA
ncbi:tRNA lysidine(34) synthetase TilS [Paenibacillus sp. FSL W7-1279]|uniref:tRNA lysidine(34) synthetase TilS n=1 Tax=Paenibacillus TaxID=44249 RepID=UPI001C7D67CA|nr:tRNA lysidine(34) synthetase TilS [Paenibacillus lautus]MBX4151691.1 tRNA lysidine(34) synthetase TilS [Paenibacillus lautus]